MIKYTFWIPKELLAKLKKLAIKDKRSTSSYMRIKLEETAEKEEK